MFWVQILAPLAVALFGLILLYADHSNSNKPFSDSFQNAKVRIVEISERQEDKSEIKQRLNEIGDISKNAYGEFRFQQLSIALLAGSFPLLAAFLMLLNFAQAIGLSMFFGIGSYYLFDTFLSTKVKRHREAIEAEFPAIIEMLTLAIAAGESPMSAFARISTRSKGKLAKIFNEVVQEVKQGRPFHEALDEMGRNMKSSTIRRFVDALVMAMVRGAPIVEVLHRHTAEARTNQRNLIMDKAGKAETTMMIPIVFLILPISVLFALWPSINQLSFFAG